jgi:hypothetical protein
MRFPRVFAASLGLLAASACGGGDLVLPAGSVPAVLEIASGDGQTGPVGSALDDAIQVRVKDADGQPIAGVEVGFALGVGATGGQLIPTAALTNADGLAGTQWVLGGTPGRQAVEATVDGAALSTRFGAIAQPAGASAIQMVSGNAQEAPAGAPLPDSLVVRVTDAFGNPVAGAVVQWSADAGTVSPAEAATGANGLAAARRILGAVPGAQTAVAAIPGLAGSPVTFSHTAIAGPILTLVVVSGNGQTGVTGAELGEPLRVRLVDEQNAGVAGRTVTWQPRAGAGTADPASSATDADGYAVSRWTLGAAAGEQALDAAVAGVGSVGFTATAEAPGELAFLTQPSTVRRGDHFDPPVQVTFPEDGVKVRIDLVRANGDLADNDLRGKDTQEIKDGVATFDDLHVDREDTGYRLRASAPDRPELGTVLSTPFDVTR